MLKMKMARIVLSIGMALGMTTLAQAGPANPEPVKVSQPDGSTFQAVMRGDEFQGWMETSDGYTVVKNPGSKFFEYATQGAGGQLRPSGVAVSPNGPARMAAQGALPPKGLRPPRNTVLQKYQDDSLKAIRAGRVAARRSVGGIQRSATWDPTPVSGPKKILAIVVNFQDISVSAGTATYWSNLIHNATGSSVAKYFSDNSFSTTSIAAVPHTQAASPAGVVTVSLAQNHPNEGGNITYPVESAWINSALAAAEPYVNFAALDTNGDGTIAVDETLVYFILAGYDTSAGSGGSPSIWAHAWGGPNVGVSGKLINHWALNGELYSAGTPMQMGVIAHEMGHAMGGLPDLYDISGTNQGLGIFSLMAGGSWGRKNGEIGGTTPVNLDAWSRQYLGWSSPRVPTTSGATLLFESPLSSTSAPVMLMNSAISTSEYWLVENRPPVGWDAGMYPSLGSWSGGLLIQHIDLNIGSKSANSFNKYVSGSHQGNMAVQPSTAACSLLASSRGCQTILFYSGNSTAFNAASLPPSNYYSGAASSLGVSNVSAPGSSMTAAVQIPVSLSTLSISSSGTGTGRVTSLPAGIDCGSTCSASYPVTASVQLMARPAAGSVFAGWSGACAGTPVTSSCTVSMSEARSVTATFSASAQAYTLSVNKAGTGAGTINSSPAGSISCGATCSASYSVNTRVSLVATPAVGSVFAGWSGACTGTSSCTVSMSEAKSVTATFNASSESYTLTVSKAGPGAGTVTSVPAGISCGTTCSASYAVGTAVKLIAKAATVTGSSVFTGWSGACAGTPVTSSCTVSMSAAKSVTATFGVTATTLGEALDNTKLTFTTSGSKNWFPQTSVFSYGGDAAQSGGGLLDDQQATLETTVTGPGTLSYWWKVSSEDGWDFLTSYLDGAAQDAITGETNWDWVGILIPAGTHTVKWVYQKDEIISEGSDAGWVDKIVFTPN